MVKNMRSVMVFDPNDSDEETVTKWAKWIRDNKSAVADKYVPNAEETRKMLNER